MTIFGIIITITDQVYYDSDNVRRDVVAFNPDVKPEVCLTWATFLYPTNDDFIDTKELEQHDVHMFAAHIQGPNKSEKRDLNKT